MEQWIAAIDTNIQITGQMIPPYVQPTMGCRCRVTHSLVSIAIGIRGEQLTRGLSRSPATWAKFILANGRSGAIKIEDPTR